MWSGSRRVTQHTWHAQEQQQGLVRPSSILPSAVLSCPFGLFRVCEGGKNTVGNQPVGGLVHLAWSDRHPQGRDMMSGVSTPPPPLLCC